MSTREQALNPTTTQTGDNPSQCPFDHNTFSEQKTARYPEPLDMPAITRDENGVWHIHNFNLARAVLRNAPVKQAGFGAEMLANLRIKMRQPILYQEGKEHQQQRKQTARFFTPKTVSEKYQQLMENISDELIRQLKRKKQMDVTKLSLTMAIKVAGEVVGLTNSYPGLTRRLEAFFESDFTALNPKHLLTFIANQYKTLAFFYLDVKPAIRARRRKPQEDVISHLISKDYTDLEILTESVTFGAAGMATTREFISVATWHLLEHPDLRQRYLAAPEEERFDILHEILRLEPVASHLMRRATEDFELDNAGESVKIASGDLVDIHLYGANQDMSIVGECPLTIRPLRELHGDRVPAMLMSFGDGEHRCPGSYIAIRETDIFLCHLLSIESLRMIAKPRISWNPVTIGYELRNFVVAVD